MDPFLKKKSVKVAVIVCLMLVFNKGIGGREAASLVSTCSVKLHTLELHSSIISAAKRGQALIVTIRFTNGSGHLVETLGPYPLSIEVRDRSNKVVGYANARAREAQLPTCFFKPLEFLPNSEQTWSVDLTKMFALDLEGMYDCRVTISCQATEPDFSGVLTAGNMIFQVNGDGFLRRQNTADD